MAEEEFIPHDEWRTIVDHVPIVAVDLVAHHDGGVLLGRRQNEPAKDEWFVPGGRLHKHERLDEAVHRIAAKEMGVEVEIDRQLDTYEHVYQTADVSDVDGKHYIAIGYEVTVVSGELQPDDQHSQLKRFIPPFDPADFHEYVVAYFDTSGLFTE